MLRYIVRRLAVQVPLLVAISIISFVVPVPEILAGASEAWRWSSGGHRGAATDEDGMSTAEPGDRRDSRAAPAAGTAPPAAAGMAGTWYLYQDRVHIVAGRHQAQHPRYVEKGPSRASPSTAPRTWRGLRQTRPAAICNVSICWSPGRRHCSSSQRWCTAKLAAAMVAPPAGGGPGWGALHLGGISVDSNAATSATMIMDEDR